MKHLIRTILLMCAICLGLLVTTPAMGVAGDNDQQAYIPIRVYVEPASSTLHTGPTHLKLRVTPVVECPQIMVTIVEARNLSYRGDTAWIATIKKGDTATYDLPVEIAANDTSGISVRVAGCGHDWDAACFFVSKDETKRLWWIDPRNSAEAAEKRSYSKRIGISDSMYWELRKPSNGTTIVGFQDENGHIISQDSAHKIGLDRPKPIYAGQGDTGRAEMTAQFDIELLVPDSAALRKAQAIVPDCKYFGREENYDLYNCHVSKATVIRLQEQRVPFRYVASELHPIRQDTATTIELPVRDSMKAHIKPVGLPKVSLVPSTTIFADSFSGA